MQMTKDEARAEYAELLPELRDFASSLAAMLGAVLSKYEPKIVYRIKSWESVAEKIGRIGLSRVANIPDLVGVRVVVSDIDALYEASETVSKQYFIEATETLHLRPSGSSTHLLVRSKASPSIGVRAEIQILTPAEEARRALDHEAAYKTPDSKNEWPEPPQATTSEPTLVPLPPVSSIKPILKLRGALNEFQELLAQPSLHEKLDVHPFIKKHPFLLFPNPDSIISEVPIGLGTEYRIDFLVRDPCGEYVLVEIENPNAPVVTKTGDLTAHLNHALCQVEDWQEWIESNLPMVERVYPGIRSPEAWVVIGRDQDLSEIGKRRISRRNINMRGRVKIRTYDDLIRDASAYVLSIENALGE